MIESSKRLIFGDKYASETTDVKFMTSKLSQIIPSIDSFDVLSGHEHFYGKTYGLNINSLKLQAGSTSPFRISVTDGDTNTLMIPLTGSCTTTVEKKDLTWSAGNFAYCKPKSEGTSITRENRNYVLIDICVEKFFEQANIMLNHHDTTKFFDFEKPSLIPLNYHHISFEYMFRQIFKVLDENITATTVLEKSRFDEMIYRTMVVMFFPHFFYNNEDADFKKIKISTSMIKLLKDLQSQYYFAHMNLSDLEQFFGLSTRNLQLVFKKQFACTPLHFLRKEKMMYAHKMLKESKGEVAITELALETGFYNFSQFSRYYREYFGELPRETKKKMF